MRKNPYIMLIGRYTGIVTAEFIKSRDIQAPKLKKGIFGADSEFPEWHQCQFDPNQTLKDGIKYDTLHTILQKLDYKINSKDGPYISPWIQKEGKADYYIIWEWTHGYIELYENQTVTYDIVAIVPAKGIKFNSENRFNLKEFKNV